LPNSTGTIHIWADSDVRLSGVSLDLIETGGGIKFTGAELSNPNTRWAITPATSVTNSLVKEISGGAIPNVTGNGIGTGSPDGQSVLFASVNYMALGVGHTSNLALRVGDLIIADWDGNSPNVHFGTASSPPVPGGIPGGSGAVGTITVSGDPPPVPPVVVDLNLGNRVQGSLIDHTFTTSAGAPPISWSNLIVGGPGVPANPPSLSSAGAFNWNSAGSPLGQYNFDVTATNLGGSDVGRLSLNLVSPAPVPVDDFLHIVPGELVTHTFRANDPDTPAASLTWSDFTFTGDGVAIQPTFDALTQLFSWNTAGSEIGAYTARVKITDPQGNFNFGTLHISLGSTDIPEPSAAALALFALLSIIGRARRK
jgi:hypothetical protein